MEKRKPHCKLAVIQEMVHTRKVRVTRSAALGASELGLGLKDMLDVVLSLGPDDFYKSMTTHADHTVWQDVYRPSTNVGDVYLKLTVIDDVLIVSSRSFEHEMSCLRRSGTDPRYPRYQPHLQR